MKNEYSICQRCGAVILQKNVDLCDECFKEVSKKQYDKEHGLISE